MLPDYMRWLILPDNIEGLMLPDFTKWLILPDQMPGCVAILDRMLMLPD